MSKKYIIVVGGVYSGTGKGISCASLAFLLKQRGHTVTCLKLDPYINTSASVLSPSEHGEVWVTDDGGETDLDLGSYERIAGIPISSRNICTSGTLYKNLIEAQENSLLGQTIQVTPHFSQEVKNRITSVGGDTEICIVELGGTVGDIESAGFYEAIRQFKLEHDDNCLIIMVAPILWVETTREFKTKPLQNAVKALQSHGLQPEILLCRTGREVPDKILNKISNHTNVPRECVFDAPDVKSIYQVPIEFYNRHVDDLIADKFHLKRNGCRIHKYRDIVEKYISDNGMPYVNIGIVGKYENCDEAYISLKEALHHAGVANTVKINITWIKAEDLESYKDLRGVRKYLDGLHGAIVPGGFDSRGVPGKILAIRYIREKKIPFLGICLGLQCAVIEYARNVCSLENADSTEFSNNTDAPVINFVPGQEEITKKSETMRLGSYDCEIVKDSIVRKLYGRKNIKERHRHRYEVNSEFVPLLGEKGLKVSGINPETGLVEIMELDESIHPYFVISQFHPEFKSRITEPHPLFCGLIVAAKNIVLGNTNGN